LSPVEASHLVHAESSYVAKRRAMDDGKNIIWDITMSCTPSTEERLDDLDRAGYSTRASSWTSASPRAVRASGSTAGRSRPR